ncbi:MAG TPA: alpha/beta fold hydrolase [Gaiellaceae bacterium]
MTGRKLDGAPQGAQAPAWPAPERVQIRWEERGSGHPLLLIQGLGYARWSWEPIVGPLAERYRVLYFDNRGIGESDKPAGPYTARQMADDAVQVLDEAGVEHAHVLGASLGGMIAQELAAFAPERVDKLVLCCTHPGLAHGLPMPAVTVALFQEAATLSPDVALRRFVVNALGEDPPAGLVEELYRRRVDNPLDPAGWQAQAAAGTTFAGVDAPIAKETLVLTGTADNVVDPGNADVLAERIPGARVERLPGLGHLFFWEDPARTVSIVEEFLG